jgi:hypothetical protein
MSSNGSKPNRGRAVKNWFDSENDMDDLKSLHSSDGTLEGRDEEEGVIPFSPKGTKTEVFAGSGGDPDFAQGVTVTRQVVVKTSFR